MKFSEHITAQHRARKAMIYIRQSSPGQVKNNTESQELQLALKQRAIDFGWPLPCIEVIDSDLGLTGTDMAERQGIQYLITQVAKNEVGIVWCWDVSRMSRNCSDWFPFLDVCAFRKVLIGDRDGIYDPITPNGRCMLGIKGQFAELEMNAIRGRLNAGLWNKAKRGELVTKLATGFVCDALGRVQKDPDLSVQNTIQNVFDMFLKLGSAGKVLRFFLANALKLPRRCSGELVWKSPSTSAILSILRNPAYAGASAYGKTQDQIIDFQTKKRKRSRLPVEEWRYLVKDKFPGYISWEVYEMIQRMLQENYSEYVKKETTGIVRKGKALVTGLVYCGACGHKIRVQYDKDKNDARYLCNAFKLQFGGSKCQNIPADPVDEFVVSALFEALSSAELNMFDEITAEQKQQDAAVVKMKDQHLERLRYQAKLAEKQFNAVDPDNRLVRVELERRWENALRELSEAEKKTHTTVESVKPAEAIPQELKDVFLDLGKNLPEIWPRLTEEKKKAFLRAMIDKVVIYITGSK
jgi:DNA invertase Pin-like site-specific DNA recombinase